MDGLSKLNRDELVRRMRADFERTLLEVADAVNAAPDGHLIDGSEEQVRDLLGEFRRRAMETAVQMRVEATEASPDFSPGEAGVGSPGCGQPVGAQLRRSGGDSSAAVSESRRRHRRGGR
ncbi:MAG: hypothetical protein ACREJC_16290 [Tepidisphaeraceae bacterium]